MKRMWTTTFNNHKSPTGQKKIIKPLPEPAAPAVDRRNRHARNLYGQPGPTNCLRVEELLNHFWKKTTGNPPDQIIYYYLSRIVRRIARRRALIVRYLI